MSNLTLKNSATSHVTVQSPIIRIINQCCFSVLYHFLKNNLSFISSLTSMDNINIEVPVTVPNKLTSFRQAMKWVGSRRKSAKLMASPNWNYFWQHQNSKTTFHPEQVVNIEQIDSYEEWVNMQIKTITLHEGHQLVNQG